MLRILAALIALVAVPGCGGGPEPHQQQGAASGDRAGSAARREQQAALRPPSCPPDATNCRSAGGRILYVERVDPDGDGDAHFVLSSSQSVTFPGITVVDVRRDLRPHPLPGPGDLLAASGPVFRGSYGQRQIQADAVRVRRSG
ncbi:MAG: hypothetical protein AABM29_01575 [Actinomycetota bacterium]